jgi:hypothetical protein
MAPIMVAPIHCTGPSHRGHHYTQQRFGIAQHGGADRTEITKRRKET